MSKTTIYFLKKNRQVGEIKIQASLGFTEYEDGIYIIEPKAINRFSKNRKLMKGSEMFFFEGNSSPIPIKKPNKKTKDASEQFLDDLIYQNFLEQTGDPRAERMKSALRFIAPLKEPGTLFKVIFVIVITWALINNLLAQYFGA